MIALITLCHHMGAGASAAADTLGVDAVKALVGDQFDQAKFDELKDGEGFVTKEALLALAPADAEPPATAVAPAAAPAPITIPLPQMTDKIDEAVNAGFTPLVCDPSGSKVDTFFSYSNGIVLDAKEASLKLAKKEITVEEALEKCRSKLAPAMKRGETLVVAMTNNSPSFSTDLSSETEFPAAELFKGAGKGIATEEWATKLFRESDTADSAGLALANPDFKVVLTTQFQPDDINEFLFAEGMGMATFSPAMFQVICIEQDE